MIYQDNQQCGSGTAGVWQIYKPDGNYTLSVRGRDINGNTGSVVSHSFRVDNTAPIITITSPPARNSSSPTIEWIANEYVKFQCSLDFRAFFDCGEGTRSSWTGNNLEDGPHSFVVIGKDAVENSGRHTHTWSQDTEAPQIQFRQLPDTGDTSPRFTWSSTELTIFQCSLDGARYENCGRGYDGQWQKSGVSKGQHTFSVRGTDASGNIGRPTKHTWNIDASGPVITLENPIVIQNRALFSWQSDKPARFYCSMDDQNSWQYCGSGTSGTRPYYNIQDGSHTFYIRGQDARRNMGSPASQEFYLDNTPPVVTVTNATRTPSFTFTSNEEATFKCAIDDTRLYQSCGEGTDGEFIARNVPNGRHAFFVQGTDKHGNVGQHVQYIFTVDTIGPVGYLTSSVPQITKSPRVRLTWMSNEDATFTCTVDGKTVDCGSGTRGEFTTDALPDGRHTFRLDLVDKVGNKGKPVDVSWETDSSSPVIQFDPNLPQITSTKPKVSWTSSEYAYYECMLDGVQRISCDRGTSGDMTFSVSTGPHTFSVRGTDRYNNVGEWKQYSFDVDGDGPVNTFSKDLPTVTKSNPTFSWSSSEAANFTCGIDNSFNLVDCGHGLYGQWTGKNIPDGEHVFIVSGTDKFGNQGPYAQHRFTVDNTVPVITFQTRSQPTNSNPEIRWSSSESASFECSLDGAEYQNCGNGFNGLWTGNNLPNGRHTFSVRGIDRNGNRGDPKNFQWRVDDQGPDLTITSNIPSQSNDPRQRITWSSTEPAKFTCKLNGQVVDCGRGTSGQYTTPNLPHGDYTLEVNGVDELGNQGTPKVVKWTTDRRPPVTSVTNNNPPRTSNPKYKLTWTSDERADFECRLNGEIVECGSGTSGEYTSNNLPDGRHTFELNAVDNVGNKGRPKVFNWITDTRPPVLTITSDNPSETNNPRQRITWDSNEPAEFECTLDGQIVSCGTGTTTNGQYTTPNLPDGKHTFSVNGVDDLGNKGTPTVIQWTTDKRGPGLVITSDNPPKTNKNAQTITWNSSEPAHFECRLNGRVVECGSGTNGVYTTPNLPDGNHTFEVTAADDLDNKGTPEVVSWSKDTQGPRVQLTNSIPRATNNPKTRITWSSNEPGTFVCLLDGVEVSCGKGTTGDYTTPDLSDGKHSFSVSSVDPLGNKGRPVTVEWETDSTAPDITFPSTLPEKTRASPLVTWTSSESSNFECALDDQTRSIRCGGGKSGEWNGLNIPHGPHTFWVRGTDNRGNVGEWKPYDFEVDSKGPEITFGNDPINTQNSPTFGWSSSEYASFKCRMENSFNEVDCGEGTNGKWSGNEISDGPHTLLVYGVDKMDNKGPVANLKFNVDATGPKVSFNPKQPLFTKNNPSFNWTSSELAKFKCALDDGQSFGQSDFVDCGEGNTGQWTGENIPDGVYRFLVYGTDNMKNRGPVAQHTFTVDNSGPAVTFSKADDVTDGSPQFTWTSEENTQFLCSLNGSAFQDCGSGRSGLWNGRNIPHGQHVFTVKGRDTNGNVGEPVHHTFNADTRPPNVAIEPPFPEKISSKSINIRWSSDESATYLCAIDNSPATNCGSDNNKKWTTPRLDDGDHTFSLTAIDRVGNRAPTLRKQWTVDTTGPKIAFAANQPTRTKNTPSFTWTSSEPANFKCGLDNGQLNFVDCGSGSSGQWTGENIPDGSYRLLVYGVDETNNRGPTAEHTFVADSSPPQITFSGDLPETTSKSPTLTWSSNEFAKFECKLEDGIIFDCGSGEDASWTGRNLNDGPHSLSVRGTDNLGNKGQFISRSWNVDESGPRLRFVGDFPSRARRLPRIRWLSNEFALFECSLNGRNFTRCGQGMQGRWSKEEVSTGSQTFTVRGRDTKGNVGEPITVTIDIDTTAPTIVLLKPLPTQTKQPTWTFTWTSNEIANFTCAVDSLLNKVDCGFGLNGRFTTEPLSDGRHRFYLLGKDELGNNARVVTHTCTVDKTKPEIEFLPNQPGISDAEITLLWKTTSNKPAESFECALDDERNMQPCGEGITGSWTDANITDGDHTLYVRAKDSFGDYGQVKTHKWKVDTKVPQVELIGTPPARSTYDTGSFYWKSDQGARYECAVDVAESGTPCGSGIRMNWNSPRLHDGEHTFYVFATDSNGNQANPVEYKWEIDTRPPIVTLDENTERVSGHNVTLKWRSNEYAIFKCAVDSIFDNRDCGSGRDSEIKLSNLDDGPHTIWIKANDELGNIAPWKKHTWNVDSQPPELDFTSKLPKKTDGDVSFFWRSKESTKFKCGTDPNNLKDCGVGQSGNWSAKNLTDGEHEFYVEATDEFGNTIRILHKWTVDNIPPLLSWRKKPPAVSGKRIKLRWKSNEKADFFCAHERIDHLERCGNLRLKGNWVTDNLPEGKHLFWVFGVDDVGNRGKPLEHEWVVDTKGPTLFFNQPVPKKSGRSVRFSWRSNEYAKFKCAIDSLDNYFDCGEGLEAQLRSDNLRRNGEHVLYVKGIDDYGNVGETISTRWIVDLVAPVLVDVGPLPRLTNRNPVITWTVNEEAVFECALDDLNKFKYCGNGTKGKWQGNDLDKGDHQFVMRVKDPQGNTKNLIDHKFVVGIPDNRGREFMLAFMQQYLHKKAGSVSLFITSDNYTVATIYIPGVNNFRQEIDLQPDELVRVDLPINVRLSGTQKESKGILVTAENELVVYGLNIMPHSTDAFLALPTDIQGTEYYAVSYTVSQHSLVAIVGIYDNTVIYITLRMSKEVPLVYQGAVYRNGDTMIIELDRQQTFQLAHTEDLTGTRIASTQVVSVYSGNECANVPKEFGYCDHLVEMLTPTSTWGRRFVTAPLFSRRSGDFFRIVASQDDTLVTFHPNDGELLKAGEFMERDVPSDEYKFITATKPCMLMQYSKGADSDDTDTDPFLIMIPPIEQYGSHYILSTPDRPRQQYFQSYINVIVLSEHFQGVLVDGKPAHVTNSFKRIPGTPYSTSAVRVTKGVHRVDHTSPIITFGAFMYGYAWRDSYGYPGGLRLADITGECTGVDTPADGMDNDCDRRIDEELKNGIDDDGDGRIDEDLATFPPTIEIDDPYYEYESCVFEVDALVPRPKAISSAECNYKGALRLTYRDSVVEKECVHLINRTWQASDGCGNVVYLNQVIKIKRPRLLVHIPLHVPNGCVGAIGLRTTGRPEIESPCQQERVRIAYRDNISKKDCQEKGLLLERHFTVTEVCGREYTGVQRIYPGARS